MKTDPGRLAVALVAVGSLMLTACNDDAPDATEASQAADPAYEVAAGPESAAEFTLLLTGGGIFEYVSTKSPDEAIAVADVIVTGTITDIIGDGDQNVMIEITVDEAVHGPARDEVYLRHHYESRKAGSGEREEDVVRELAEAGVGLRVAVSAAEIRNNEHVEGTPEPQTLMKVPAPDAFFLQGSTDSGMHSPYMGYPASKWGAKTIDAYAELIRQTR